MERIEKALGRKLKKAESRIVAFCDEPRTTGQIIDELGDNNPAYVVAVLKDLETGGVIARVQGKRKTKWLVREVPTSLPDVATEGMTYEEHQIVQRYLMRESRAAVIAADQEMVDYDEQVDREIRSGKVF